MDFIGGFIEFAILDMWQRSVGNQTEASTYNKSINIVYRATRQSCDICLHYFYECCTLSIISVFNRIRVKWERIRIYHVNQNSGQISLILSLVITRFVIILTT